MYRKCILRHIAPNAWRAECVHVYARHPSEIIDSTTVEPTVTHTFVAYTLCHIASGMYLQHKLRKYTLAGLKHNAIDRTRSERV